jgi:hypothetical protein
LLTAEPAGDRTELVFWARYLGRRFEKATGVDRAELSAVVRELEEWLADPQAREKGKRLERRVEIGKLLKGRIGLSRGELDGRDAAAREAGRRLTAARF